MEQTQEQQVELIVKEVRKIAESKLPAEIDDESFKEAWITGFVSGYLYRVKEEIITNVKNLKKND